MVLRTELSSAPKQNPLHKKKLDRKVSLGQAQEGQKTNCDDITQQFLRSLSCCQLAVPCTERLVLCSTEQLQLSTECHWPLFSPRKKQEMAVLPVSLANCSVKELKKLFSSSPLNSEVQLHIYENSNIKEENMEDGNSDFLFLQTQVMLAFMHTSEHLSCLLNSLCPVIYFQFTE